MSVSGNGVSRRRLMQMGIGGAGLLATAAQLPGVTSVALVAAAQDEERGVLIMSGTIDIGGQSVTSLGAAHCLSKPFTINRLIDAANHAAGLA